MIFSRVGRQSAALGENSNSYCAEIQGKLFLIFYYVLRVCRMPIFVVVDYLEVVIFGLLRKQQ